MTESRTLEFGFSPCPNDTFAFWALVSGAVSVAGVHFAPCLADIEALNQRAVHGPDPLPLTKLSLPAFAHVIERYVLLRSGAALGHGCGPLVVRRRDDTHLLGVDDLRGCRIAIPGRLTTAKLLLDLFGPEEMDLQEMRFDRIMPAVAAGDVDAGLVIHESRFTYAAHGLEMVTDLGFLWEQDCGLPLPLGVIAAARDLPAELVWDIERGVRRSVDHALNDPAAPRAYVREHSQELDDAVCDQHIALYVNDFTEDVGGEGQRAIEYLLRRGRESGFLPESERDAWVE